MGGQAWHGRGGKARRQLERWSTRSGLRGCLPASDRRLRRPDVSSWVCLSPHKPARITENAAPERRVYRRNVCSVKHLGALGVVKRGSGGIHAIFTSCWVALVVILDGWPLRERSLREGPALAAPPKSEGLSASAAGKTIGIVKHVTRCETGEVLCQACYGTQNQVSEGNPLPPVHGRAPGVSRIYTQGSRPSVH